MLSAPLGYKIMFRFDMPDGTKNGGITTKPDALYWIWQIYREHKGRNLVVEDMTFYIEKDDNELREETQTPIRTADAQAAAV